MINKFICVMPMAGSGLRFKKYGYHTPKPLIKVDGEPMFIKAAKSFPKYFKWLFIANKNLKSLDNFKKYTNIFERKKILFLNKKTQGQASTVYKSLNYINNKDFIIVHSCDLFFNINLKSLTKKLKDNDLLVFTAKATKYHFKNHKQFSWVKKNKKGYQVSLKKNFKDIKNSKVLIGTFCFRNKKIMKKLLDHTFQNKIKIKNEYYMDSLIKDAFKFNYRLNELTVNKYISLGSHKELRNYILK